MHVRRQKLTQWIALQASAAAATDPHQITEFQMFPLREPVSGRTYTVVRLRREIRTDRLWRMRTRVSR